MARKRAHELTAELATEAYKNHKPLIEVLMKNDEVAASLNADVLAEIADPFKYVGQSRDIVQEVYRQLHGRKTLKV